MGIELVGREKTHIIGGDHGAVVRGGKGHGAMQILVLVGAAGAMQFEVVTLREVCQPAPQQRCGVFALAEQRLPHVAEAASRERDQTLARGPDPVPAQGRPTLDLTFQITARHEACEVAVPDFILHQQGESRRRGTIGVNHGELGPADGLETPALGGFIEFHQREKIADVGQRDRRHPQFGGAFDQLVDTDQTVHQ